MTPKHQWPIASVIGSIPYRLALAGGWIDQPFVSRHNPKPPGSMVVVSLEPAFRFMDRSGLATGTRAVATKLWRGKLPQRPPAELIRNSTSVRTGAGAEPSGSQDMVGLIYPGISRLDYDFAANGGVFPAHIESLNDPRTRPLAGAGDPRAPGCAPARGLQSARAKEPRTRSGSPAWARRARIASRQSGVVTCAPWALR